MCSDFCKYTILEHVSQGLQKLHDMSVLHRDLKCLNILLDGESGECESCHHTGRWKICDFGEAKILRTPTLAFATAKPWTKPVAGDRFRKITAQSLYDAGARHYCWLHPGETEATAAGEPAGPYASTDARAELETELESLEWDYEAIQARAAELGVTELYYTDSEGHEQPKEPRTLIREVMTVVNPFPLGALVYSFSEDPSVVHKDNCVFAVTPSTAVPSSQTESTFPTALRSFNVVPAKELERITPLTEHICLDLTKNTYTIRKQECDRSEWSHQVDCLHVLYPDGISGSISKPHPIGAMSKLDRRRRRIPTRRITDGTGDVIGKLEATHFVFAYQLDKWTNEKFSAKQLEQFQVYSGEISLASFGGFVYLGNCKFDEVTGDLISHRIVGVNALSMGPAPTYDGGAIDRTDKNVTATIASPEMCDMANIGLEADMYSFGIVMWEVFTRRVAWHWMGAADGNAICDKVGNERLRPKVPVDVSPQCAKMLRECLHTDPDCRPTAKEMGNWLRDQKNGLRKHMQSQETESLKESDEIKQKAATTPRGRTTPSSPRQTCSITDRNHERAKHWNHGRYSLESTDGSDGSFSLTVNSSYLSDWEERALERGDSGGLPAPTVVDPTQKLMMKAQPFGLRFSNQWPTITTIETETKGAKTLASMFPQIKVGCRVMHINGVKVSQLSTFKDAVPMLQALPLTLEFSSPAQAIRPVGFPGKPWPTQQPSLGSPDMSAIPAWLGGCVELKSGRWIDGGLQAVAMVFNHEQKQAVRAQGQSGGLAAVALAKGHEEWQLQGQLAAARAEIEELKRQLAARPPQQPLEADPGASQRAHV